MIINQCQAMRESDVSPADDGGRGEEDVHMVDVEVKAVEAVDVSKVKRKRGRPPRTQGKQQQQQQQQLQNDDDEAEDVCFICFDGGSLVLCDRRGCPKAYHPACIKRDESFFKSKAKWNCGWHICSSCQKASHYMCYTCTYSLCKGCTRNADYVCVRGNKGLCGTCMRTIMLIENVTLENTESVQVDFDDKTSWEYLFKIYWIFLKAKLSLTVDELNAARNPWKGDELPKAKNCWKGFGSIVTAKEVQVYPGELGPCLDNYGHVETNHSRRRKFKDQVLNEQNALVTVQSVVDKVAPLPEGTNWATKELLEFVSHMRNGDMSMVSQFDAQALLLEYIKRNNLRDPRQKSQIICDARLLKLFGKPRVGHFEMLKLLEYHFLAKEKSLANDSVRMGIAGSQIEAAGSSNSQVTTGNDRRRKTRKKVDERVPQINLNPDEYAAIDVHNINLLYLKRNLMENLMDESEKFHENVVGSFVRIRISGSDQKQDMYRLVQVVGTSKTAESYNIGSKTTDVMLEILNLNKKETVSIDGISNQEFSEDECRRLRQSIKCGLIKRLKVGEIQEKALALQPVRVNDLLEAEISRLNHLRDRASEKGQRKNLREFVEKLDILKSPMERQRRLLEIPDVHMDPKMDPSYESDEEAGESAEIKQDDRMKTRHGGRKGLEVHSPLRGGDQNNVENRELKNLAEQSRNLSVDRGGNTQAERANEAKWSQGGGTQRLNNPCISKNQLDPVASVACNHSGQARSGSFLALSGRDCDSEMEKLWHYQDPYGKVQGPFAMMQLRKWSTSGLFPSDLRVWRIDEKQDDSILLTDALTIQCPKEPLQPCNGHLLPQETGAASNGPDKKLELGINLSTRPTIMNSRRIDNDGKLVRNDGAVNVNGDGGNELASLSVHSSTCTKPVDVAITSDRQVQSSLERRELSNDGRLCDNSLSQPRSSREDDKWSSHPGYSDPKLHKTMEGQTNIRESDEKRVESEGHSSQSSGQNWRPQPFDISSGGWDSSTGCVSMAKSSEKADLNHEIDVSDQPSRAPKQNLEVLKDQAENKPSNSSNAPIEGSGPSSTLAVGGQLPEVADDWGDYSSVSAKHSTEVWDLNLAYAASLKSGEGASDHTATPTSGTEQLTNSSPPHPAIDTSSWQPLVPEANEFCSLVDESVSDLLAEVEAMESLGGMPSPTSKMSCRGELTPDSDDDCFSPIETFSSALDPGKSDAFSSSCDVQKPAQLNAANVLLRLSLMPSQPAIADEPLAVSQMSSNVSQMPLHSTVRGESCRASQTSSRLTLSEEPLGFWQTDDLESRKSFSGHSSSNVEMEGDTKPSDISVNKWNRHSEIQPPASLTVNHFKAGLEIQASSLSTVSQSGSNSQHPALSNADTWWGTGNGSIHSSHRVVSQGNVNMIFGSSHGSNQHQASTTSVFSTANSSSWGNQQRYGGDNKFPCQRENYFQNRDSGCGSDRSSWNRQPAYGNLSGSNKPSGKGQQRVCKFYESGYCKKGASCSYLHP